MTPKEWGDLVGAVLAAIIIALWKLFQKLDKTQKDIKVTKTEVTNEHGTNLRDDITEISKDVKYLMKKVDQHDQNAHETHKEIFERIRKIENDKRKEDDGE